jgi:hypothetical protein
MHKNGLAIPGRLELPTYGLGNRRSIRLSYGTECHSRTAVAVMRPPYQSRGPLATPLLRARAVISPSSGPDAGKTTVDLAAQCLGLRGEFCHRSEHLAGGYFRRGDALERPSGRNFIRKSLTDLNFVPAAGHNAVRHLFTVGYFSRNSASSSLLC